MHAWSVMLLLATLLAAVVLLQGPPKKEHSGVAGTGLDINRADSVDKLFDKVINENPWKSLPESKYNYTDTMYNGVTSMARMQFWL